MSLAQPPQEYRASPLMSNNPFRNRIAQPQPQLQSQAQLQPQLQPRPEPQRTRPVSTNPFLDSNELIKVSTNPEPPLAKDSNGISDIFGAMNIGAKPLSPVKTTRAAPNGVPGRTANEPPRPLRSPPLNHRPTGSEEERQRQGMPARRGTEMDIFADPSEAVKFRERTSIRRNSESSVRDRPNSLLDSEEEKKRRDRKSRDPRPSKYRPSRKMDIIDKLDVTSIYGAGLFHHDGPFDACNPNRNKRRHRFAPIHAFPKDSANMQIGGSGPVNKRMDYERFHGFGQEAHRDFNEAAAIDEESDYIKRPLVTRNSSFNPVAPETVHGHETAGLGSTTFLEGAPASRAAMERKESENYETQQQQTNGMGLSRKKSLAQKIRGVRGPSNRVQSPELEQSPASPLPTGRSDGGTNPFFKDYDNEYEKKGAQIAQAEEQAWTGRGRALSSPRPVPILEVQTVNGTSEAPQDNKPSGLLGRMKSLKKTKSRPERREAS